MNTLTRTELPALWRAAIAAGEALTAGYADITTSESELDRLEANESAARDAMTTHLLGIGLTKQEIGRFPL